MNIRTVCLALLAHGEASGYDLKTRWTEGPFSHFVDASFASIYPALARLESEGLVTRREDAQPGKPPRKVYAITEAGRAAFVEALSQPPAPDFYRSPFAMVALCAPFLDREILSRAIDARLAHQQAELEKLRAIRESSSYAPINWLLDWGISHFSSDRSHVEHTRQALEDAAGGGTPGTALPVCPSRAVAGH